MASIVSGYQGVAEVVDDSSILNNFYKLLDGARNAVVIIALFLLVAAILLVANTIRLSAFNRRRETSIMRLVGASNFYVQLPFLAEGMIAGLVGWLIASGLLIAVKSLWLNGLQTYFPYGVTLSTTDLVEVVIIAHDHRPADLRQHLVPDPQALPARLTRRVLIDKTRGCGTGHQDHRPEQARPARLRDRGRGRGRPGADRDRGQVAAGRPCLPH